MIDNCSPKIKTKYNTVMIYFPDQPNRLGLKNISTASLQMGKPLPNECPGCDTKQSDIEALVLEL